MNKQPNPSIQCSVSNCSHHCSSNCCSLNEIKVGCCGSVTPKSCASTECASFHLSSEAKPGC